MMGAAGSGGPKIYVEDVFSTWLYTGNGSTQTITNGIDLSGKGGLVWNKSRSLSGGSGWHFLYDTARGVDSLITSNDAAPFTITSNRPISSFNSNGFTTDYNAAWVSNNNGSTYASWTFRKAAKFFDVVTYAGDGSNRTIAHSLGSVPGTIIVKRTDTAADWQVYHRSLANTEYLVLNSTAAKATGATRWNSTTPTSTVFSLGTDATVNASGGTYVAYLFAHDAGGFGDSGNDSVVKCGSFTTPSVGGVVDVDLGWEAQWILLKSASNTGAWYILDNMRGWSVGSADQFLRPDSSNAEGSVDFGHPTATGFTTAGLNSSQTYIYIAIRRGPMKTPTDATKVFNAVIKSVDNTFTSTNHVVDLLIESKRTSVNTTYQHLTLDRLRGTNALTTFSTAAEYAGVVDNWFSSNTGFNATNFYAPTTGDYLFWAFRRAPGFFDVVAYTGTGSARTVAHNLGVAPELMIVKKRSATDNWVVYAGDATDYLILNTTAATADLDTMWNDTAPTSAVFSLGTNDDVNGNTATFIAYLFATAPGVSKVGSYTGTGTTLNVDCGFTAGARFVLIKRTDSTGDWYVWDTARGIVSGNDSYLLLNSTAAEVTSTDYIDPLSSGFQISSTAPAAINANGGSFIFLAIA